MEDQLATPHSGRHTFYALSRRAGCDQGVIECLAGHNEVTGSRSAKKYGLDARRSIESRNLKGVGLCLQVFFVRELANVVG